MMTSSKMIFVGILTGLSLALLIHVTEAMFCIMGQEPDPNFHHMYRWVIPVEDPCQCTQIRLGGVNTRTPWRPFSVTYYDTYLRRNNLKEIRQWLNCPKITCATIDLSPTINGLKSTCTNDNEPYGTICTLSCDRGYRATSSVYTQRTCQSSGSGIGMWSGDTITCTQITCTTIEFSTLSNGLKSNCTNSNEPYGTICTLSCDRHGGYRATLSVQGIQITCQSNSNDIGMWSGDTITCTLVTCPPPLEPTGGVISGCYHNGNYKSHTEMSEWPLDSSCAFACNAEGYALTGSSNRTCLETGTWDGSDTECKVLSSCRAYIDAGLSNGSGNYKIRALCNDSAYNELLDVYCDQESNGGGWMRFYYKKGSQTCFKYDFNWTGDLISCLGIDTHIMALGVSDDYTTITRNNSWILSGDNMWRRFEMMPSGEYLSDEHFPDVIANLANCKTPSNTDWSQDYGGGYVRIVGRLSTNGNLEQLFSGNGGYKSIGEFEWFTFGGASRYSGLFINTQGDDFTVNANERPTSLWDTDNERAIWIKI